MIIRPCRLVLLAAFFVPVSAWGQLSYSHTTLIHGFNDNATRFTTPNTAGLLSGYVNLKEVQTPSLTGSLPIRDQATNLRPSLYGSHVLSGLSMGGLTSRAAYFDNSAGIAGIVTVATPHNGALIANNATQVTGYVSDVVADFFQSVHDIMYRPEPTTILSTVIVELIRYVAREHVYNRVKVYLDAQFGTKSAALHDIKTTSPTIAWLNGMGDPLPHANVFGTIGRRNAVASRDGAFGVVAFRGGRSFGRGLRKSPHPSRRGNPSRAVVRAARSGFPSAAAGGVG